MNAPSGQHGPTKAGTAHPSKTAVLSFFFRSTALQSQRLLADTLWRDRPLKNGNDEKFPFVLAESVTPLRTNTDPREHYLHLGKIENLRLACRQIHCKVLAPGDTFSFWRQVGGPWRLRGFKKGREVREGCVIPTTGGGLCQLSGSLLQVAMSAGCELIERHRHSALPADVLYDASRDATIFWNYVDLRFRVPLPILFECYLTTNELVVRMRAKSPKPSVFRIEAACAQHVPLRIEASCYTCFKTACLRQCNPHGEEKPGSYKTAFLIDEPQAELNAYVNRSVRSGDHLLQNSSGTDLRFEGDRSRLVTKAFPLFRLRRAWKLRSTVLRGGTVAKAHFELAQLLARTYCKHVDYDVEHICLAQTLLPQVWKAGSLAGRSFDVLMYRLPINVLEEKLERATALYPYSKTLEEFRAPKWFAEAEEEALRAARRIVTPHPQIAALFKNAMRIAWDMPSREIKAGSGDREKDLVVFFGPTIARKGAYAVREIVKQLGCELTAVGSELEGPDFWRGLRVRRIELASLPWDRIHTVLQPALFEFWPRHLLRAQAAGSHLLISDCCGIEENHENGVYHVPFGDPASAVAIMETLLANRGKALCV
jgi:VanW like protein